MTAADLAVALQWARAEGWNPGRDDAADFLGADPGGFLVLDDPSGAPAASISIVRVGPARHFLGLFICRADLRGQGYAGPLWRAAMARAAGGPVGLDGVAAEQGRYAARGFVRAHRTVRFAGRVPPAEPRGSRPLEPADHGEVAALDTAATGFARPEFLRRWMREGPGRHVRAVHANGRLVAVAAMRACAAGWKIGPLLARGSAAAEMLLCDLAGLANGEQVMVDAPEDTAGAGDLPRALGFAPVFEAARMWHGEPPRRGGFEYGVATLELG